MIPAAIQTEIYELRRDSQFLHDMCGVYPGDPTGDLSKEAYFMSIMADVLENHDYTSIVEEYELLKEINKVTITYENADCQ